MKKKIIFGFLALLTILSTIEIHAWAEPKQGEEIPAVLNTSSDGQEKKGWLNINNWIRVITDPFSFDVGVESPKFCIKKPDGTQSCCPPKAGEDWSDCVDSMPGGSGGKWVWNTAWSGCSRWDCNKMNSSFDMLLEYPLKDSKKVERSENRFCDCYNQNGLFTGTVDRFHLYGIVLTSHPSYYWNTGSSCAEFCGRAF